MNSKETAAEDRLPNAALAGFENLLSHRYFGVALALLFFTLSYWGWVGFLGSDDVTFARGAYGWIEQFPYVGGHGTIRYPITIPMALSFLTLGNNEVAMVLPSYLAMMALYALLWITIKKMAGIFCANLCLLVLITTPLLVIQATIASVDIVEAFFLFSSFLLFWKYVEGERRSRYLVFAGMLAGLAFLTRETAVFVALFFGILFLRGYRFPRANYLLIGVGFVAVWLVEICYLWIMTGDPLYRFNISLHHDSTIDRSIDVAGNLIIHPAIDPILVLLFNQEFMLLFWLAIPLSIWICFVEKHDTQVRRFARLLALFGLVWFLAVGAATTLLPLNPRYFMITTISIAVVMGLALHQIWMHHGKRPQLLLVISAVLAVNWVGVYVENKDSLFGERQYAQLVSSSPSLIYTDPNTRYRSDMLLKWNNGSVRAKGEAPAAGSLFYYNPARADMITNRMNASMQARFQPQESWETIGEFQPAPSKIIIFLEKTGANKIVPQHLLNKLKIRHPTTILYRVR